MRPHKLEAGQSSQIFGVPFPQLRVLGLLSDNWVFHDGVAEMIHNRSDSEDTAQPLVQTFSGVVCLAAACALFAPAKTIGEALSASPVIMLRLVREVEMSCAIAHFLSGGDRLSPTVPCPPGCEVPEHLMARGL
jgi:hypothetical protein